MAAEHHPQSKRSTPAKISDLTYVIPFGRYAGSSQVGPEADEVLVGRAGHRAYFIDLLISAGRQGAFLVTGRRGAGKTSFVSHCIAEYEASVFKRFLCHNVGRAFWDRVAVVAFWAVVLIAGLLISDFAQILVHLTAPGPHRMLLWVLLIPIGVVLLFPCVYARAVLEVVFESRTPVEVLERRSDRRNRVRATVWTLVGIVLLWIAPGLASPAWSASALFTVLAALYLGVQALSFDIAEERPHRRPMGLTTKFRRRTRRLRLRLLRRMWTSVRLRLRERVLRWILCVFFSLLLTAVTCWTLYVSLAWSLRATIGTTSAFKVLVLMETVAINLGAGLFMLGGGLALRGWYQRYAAFPAFWDNQPPSRRKRVGDPMRQALRGGGMTYVFAAAVLAFIVGYLLIIFRMPISLLAVPIVTILLGVYAGARILLGTGSPKQASRFRPGARSILVAGALVSVVLSLQLAQPVLQRIADPTLRKDIISEVGRHSGTTHSDQLGGIGPTGKTHVLALSLASVPGLQRPETGEGGLKGWTVFWDRFESLAWVVLLLATFSLLHFIQYEWIIRPHVAAREDGALDPFARAPWDDHDFLSGSLFSRWRAHRNVAQLTLPWMVYRVWLPSLTIPINVGLESRQGAAQAIEVIQTTLVGLRERYHRTFTSWNAGPTNVGRMAALLVLLVLVTLSGDLWFRPPTAGEIALLSEEASQQRKVVESGRGSHNFASEATRACAILAATREVRPTRFPDLVCRLGEGWFQLLYLDLMPAQLAHASSQAEQPQRMGELTGERLLLYALLPYRDPLPASQQDLCVAGEPPSPACRWSQLFPPGLHFNLYHVLLFFGFLMAGRWTMKRLPLFPYKRNLQRIDDLLDSMTARTRVTQRPTLWEPARWIYSLVADRVKETERGPLDVRTVELAFLQILEEIQRRPPRIPGINRALVNIPTPEIAFIFDELEQLVDPLDEKSSTRGSGSGSGSSFTETAIELRSLEADRQKALRLRHLLAELKNILSLGQARFIVIGGRDLHDEWLADQTAREPLLSNIFAAEIYLPSLMADSNQPTRSVGIQTNDHDLHHLQTRTAEFIFYQHRRAQRLYKNWTLSTYRPAFTLEAWAVAQDRFASEPAPSPVRHGLRLYLSNANASPAGEQPAAEAQALLEDFTAFLTHRSMGMPKRLKELLASFIRPLSQEVAPPLRWQLGCQHILRFRDRDLFRLQLIASFYRHLSSSVERRVAVRDDKVAISILFLSDFLIKFHRHPFSWSNLDRTDELAHIYRTQDLRDIQREMVDLLSGRFLELVSNGMYAYRFHSDFSREVDYLSRCSAAEMVALNFTLHESQSLKALYHDSLKRRETHQQPTPTLVASLGELYEFDQEYETARHYYRRAIELLDDDLRRQSGSIDAVHRVLRGEHDGMKDARVFLAWGETRLKLMLQIGMTLELARAYDQAVTEYRSARTLAQALLRSSLGLDLFEEEEFRTSGPGPLPGRFHTLRRFNLLFQPTFAEVWASEKISSTVDAGDALVEAVLQELRQFLPFGSRSQLSTSRVPATSAPANMALSMSQLHNGAGDIYFFKGRQPASWNDMIEPAFWAARIERDRPTEGYLLRSHYHYAVSLHEIRRYISDRVTSSRHLLSLAREQKATLLAEALPDFLWRAAAGSMNDLAEVMQGTSFGHSEVAQIQHL